MEIHFDLLSDDDLSTSTLKLHLFNQVRDLAEALPDQAFVVYDKNSHRQPFPCNVRVSNKRRKAGWLNSILSRTPKETTLTFALFNTTIKLRKGTVLLVADLSALIHPEQFNKRSSLQFRNRLVRALDVCAAVIVFNDYNRQLLEKSFRFPKQKIYYWDIAPLLISPAITYTEAEALREKNTEGKSYFIVAGDLHPRQQLLLLLKAFSDFKKWQRSGMILVIAGYDSGFLQELKTLLSTYKYREDVLLIPDPEDKLFQQLIAGAYCLVHPAAYEPFPVMINYALELKVPVISIDLPETRSVAADGIIYTNNDATDLSRAMQHIYKDERWRSQVINKGMLSSKSGAIKGTLSFIHTFIHPFAAAHPGH